MSETKGHFRVGLVQMRSGRDVRENLFEAEALISEAARKGAHFVQTPENTLLMETDADRLLQKIGPEELTEPIAHFSGLAKSLRIWLHIGSIAIKAGEDRAINRAYVFAPDGQIALRYDKIHMFDVNLPSGETYRESSTFVPGKTAYVLQIPWAASALRRATTSASRSSTRRLPRRAHGI